MRRRVDFVAAMTVLILLGSSLHAGARRGEDEPWNAAEALSPTDAAKLLGESSKPSIIYVGPHALYRQGHVPGAVLHGPASQAAGLEDLKQWAAGRRRSDPVVIYCGCCPIDQCPNVRPAFKALRELGFTNLRVVVMPTSFQKDWVDASLPVQR
jgi:thiosulfate/3-mercaptopyruvate sulfurtransferase